jgi:CRP-like cAMP-binding protein
LKGDALAISTRELKRIAADLPKLRKAINSYQSFILVQAQQTAVCHALHTVSERLCRWLLHSEDIAQSKEFFLTQEFLSIMLGVRRSSVSTQAHELQAAGLIKYSRGHIEILNRPGLLKHSCECYKVIQKHGEYLKRETE